MQTNSKMGLSNVNAALLTAAADTSLIKHLTRLKSSIWLMYVTAYNSAVFSIERPDYEQGSCS